MRMLISRSCHIIRSINRTALGRHPRTGTSVHIYFAMADSCSDPEALAPIHTLPNEILSTIFESGYHSAGRSTQLMLHYVSLVCSRWRAVMLGTPQLWTRVHIDLRRRGSSRMVSHY